MKKHFQHSKREKENAKRRFTQAYLKAGQTQGKIRVRKKEIYWSEREFRALEELATLHDRQLAVYLRELIHSAIADTPIIPEEYEKSISDLSKEVMRIANNVNQIVRYVHQSKSVSMADIERIYYNVAQLETEVRGRLRAFITKPEKENGTN